ncbi:MAG: YeeE/YedE thiosulfate transporter family protein [Methanosarcinaceae archaeon]|nr:YeeE/YedE thiosulfate transporter family protein [Methanosarcinaceae archaeon]
MVNIILVSILIGLIYGFTLQKCQICFTSAFRDYFLFKEGQLIKALLFLVLLQMILFHFFASTGLIIEFDEKQGGILSLVIGGLIFGVGAIFAGGCASGTLYRVGEGQMMSVFALFGMLFGIGLFAELYDILNRTLIQPLSVGNIRIPELLNISSIAVVTIGAIFFLIILLLKNIMMKKQIE